jgi:uncharacterized protein (DUF4415 family)
MSLKDIANTEGKSDFSKIKNTSSEEEFDDEFDWSDVEVVRPNQKTAISLRIDPEVLAFFKQNGKGYQTRINAVLKSYVKAHQAS